MKYIVLGIAGLAAIAFGLVFGNWNLSEGVFFNAPIMILTGLVLMGFAWLVWKLDAPKPDPQIAREFMVAIYEMAASNAESAVLFEDDDGWFKLVEANDDGDSEREYMVYDKTELFQLMDSIRDYLADKDREGFILRKFMPSQLSDVEIREEDGNIFFLFTYKDRITPEGEEDFGDDDNGEGEIELMLDK